MKLILHRGARQVAAEELAGLPPSPSLGSRHYPIPHDTFLNVARATVADFGLTVKAEAFGLSKENDQFFGVLGIGGNGFETVFGLRNSHSQRFPAGMSIGSRVFVCDNLAFNGDVVLARRNTMNALRDLPGVAARAVSRLVALQADNATRYDRYMNASIGDKEAHDIIVRAFLTGAMLKTSLDTVVQEWREPSHDEFKGRNLWGLFNAFTEAAKGDNPFEGALQERTGRLHALFDLEVGFTPTKLADN